MALPPDHLLVVSEDRGLRLLLREELKEKLCFPVESCSTEELSLNPELTMGALVVAPPGSIPKVAPLVPKERPAIALTFSTVDEHIQDHSGVAKALHDCRRLHQSSRLEHRPRHIGPRCRRPPQHARVFTTL